MSRMNTSDFEEVVSENKWILITGANRGLGYEAAKILLSHKHPVLIAARTLAKAEKAVEQLRGDTHRAAIAQPLELDVADPVSISAAVARLHEQRDQKIGVLVNNAGTANEKQWSQQTWDEIMAVNLAGALSLTEQLLPVMAEGGRVVMVSSDLGKTRHPSFPSEAWSDRIEGLPASLEAVRGVRFDPDDAGGKAQADASRSTGGGVPVYRISKALLNKAVQALAQDDRVKEQGQAVLAVCPGWCRTRLGSDNASDPAWKGGARIAWAVEHKDPATLSGRFWHADGDSPDTMHGIEYGWTK